LKNIFNFSLAYLTEGGNVPENAIIAGDTVDKLSNSDLSAIVSEFNESLNDSEFYGKALYLANVFFETEGDGGLIDLEEGVTPETVISGYSALTPFRSIIRFISLYPLYSGDPTATNPERLKPEDF
jgi:hypothetical protein